MRFHPFKQLSIKLAGTLASAEYLAPILLGRDIEWLLVAILDTRSHLISLSAYPGCAESVKIPANDIILEVLEVEGAGILMAHNHPGGSSVPSESDILATKRISEVLNYIDLILFDHIIFGGLPYFSFRQRGLL
jgi:DNA repair protein RadC